MNYPLLGLLIIAYLIGSLSFAIIISKLMRLQDPRKYGSNNPGATNVMRSGNKKAAGLTLLLDFFKGIVVVALARDLLQGVPSGEAIIGLSGVLVVIGHIFPVFFKFKGGKGVATALGAFLMFSPILALLVVLSWGLVFKISKISGLAAIVATILAPLFAFFIFGNTSYFGATLIIALFVLFRHYSNIRRLIKGQELGFKKEENK